MFYSQLKKIIWGFRTFFVLPFLLPRSSFQVILSLQLNPGYCNCSIVTWSQSYKNHKGSISLCYRTNFIFKKSKEHTFEHLRCTLYDAASDGDHKQSFLGQTLEWPWRMLPQERFLLESILKQFPWDFSALFLQIL